MPRGADNKCPLSIDMSRSPWQDVGWDKLVVASRCLTTTIFEGRGLWFLLSTSYVVSKNISRKPKSAISFFSSVNKNAWYMVYSRFSLSSRNRFKAMVGGHLAFGFMSNTICENFDLKKTSTNQKARNKTHVHSP